MHHCQKICQNNILYFLVYNKYVYINRKKMFYEESEIYYCLTYINGTLDILRWFEHVSDEFRMTCIKLKST